MSISLCGVCGDIGTGASGARAVYPDMPVCAMLLLLLGGTARRNWRFKSWEIVFVGPENWDASKKWCGGLLFRKPLNFLFWKFYG